MKFLLFLIVTNIFHHFACATDQDFSELFEKITNDTYLLPESSQVKKVDQKLLVRISYPHGGFLTGKFDMLNNTLPNFKFNIFTSDDNPGFVITKFIENAKRFNVKHALLLTDPIFLKASKSPQDMLEYQLIIIAKGNKQKKDYLIFVINVKVNSNASGDIFDDDLISFISMNDSQGSNKFPIKKIFSSVENKFFYYFDKEKDINFFIFTDCIYVTENFQSGVNLVLSRKKNDNSSSRLDKIFVKSSRKRLKKDFVEFKKYLEYPDPILQENSPEGRREKVIDEEDLVKNFQESQVQFHGVKFNSLDLPTFDEYLRVFHRNQNQYNKILVEQYLRSLRSKYTKSIDEDMVKTEFEIIFEKFVNINYIKNAPKIKNIEEAGEKSIVIIPNVNDTNKNSTETLAVPSVNFPQETLNNNRTEVQKYISNQTTEILPLQVNIQTKPVITPQGVVLVPTTNSSLSEETETKNLYPYSYPYPTTLKEPIKHFHFPFHFPSNRNSTRGIKTPPVLKKERVSYINGTLVVVQTLVVGNANQTVSDIAEKFNYIIEESK